jgi:hypothetical protein
VYRQLGRESEARAEIAAFEKLEKARKETSQVYSRTREGFSDVDPNPADTPNNQPQ